MTEIDSEILKLKKRMAELQDKKKKLLVKEKADFATLIFDKIQADENFYKDLVKILEQYKAQDVIEILQKQKQQSKGISK